MLSIVVGRVTLSWDVWSAQDAVSRAILVELRLPRAILGLLVGGSLGLAGAAMQGYLRNSLAEPGTLGISAMSALGAVLSIFFNIAGLHPVRAADLRRARRHDRHDRTRWFCRARLQAC